MNRMITDTHSRPVRFRPFLPETRIEPDVHSMVVSRIPSPVILVSSLQLKEREELVEQNPDTCGKTGQPLSRLRVEKIKTIYQIKKLYRHRQLDVMNVFEGGKGKRIPGITHLLVAELIIELKEA